MAALAVLAQDGSISAERIREQVESSPLTGPNGEPLKVTISIGVAVFPDAALEPESLLRAADIALYRAKDLGAVGVAARASGVANCGSILPSIPNSLA